jgi:hypothetical protein
MEEFLLAPIHPLVASSVLPVEWPVFLQLKHGNPVGVNCCGGLTAACYCGVVGAWNCCCWYYRRLPQYCCGA